MVLRLLRTSNFNFIQQLLEHLLRQSQILTITNTTMLETGDYDLRRWRTRINITIADKDKIDLFIRWKLIVYSKIRWQDNNL